MRKIATRKYQRINEQTLIREMHMKKDDNGKRQVKKVHVNPYYLANIIVLIIMLVLVGILFATSRFSEFMSNPNFDNTFWALAISLIASVLFSFFNIKLFQKEGDDSQVLVEDIKKIVGQNNQTIISMLNLYSPIKTYRASDTPIDDFNITLNHEFINSQTYQYMGDKAEYLTSRLEQLKNDSYRYGRAVDLEILLPHIVNDYFVTSRLDSLKRREPYVHIGDMAVLKNKMVKDYKIGIIKSLCAFCHLKPYYQFNIYFYDDLPFIRYEILDNIMVLSLLTMDAHKKYPPTFIYSKESPYYNAFSQHHYNMIKKNKDKNYPHFDNSTLNYNTIKAYASEAGLSEEEIKELFI